MTESAEADLAEIWAYTAQEASETIATRFLSEIEVVFVRLQSNPLIGPRRELLASDLRVMFHGAYAIYYTASADALVIVRVVHGARDVVAIAEQGGFA